METKQHSPEEAARRSRAQDPEARQRQPQGGRPRPQAQDMSRQRPADRKTQTGDGEARRQNPNERQAQQLKQERQEAPRQRREERTQQEPRQRREEPRQRREATTTNREAPTTNREASKRRQEAPRQRREAPERETKRRQESAEPAKQRKRIRRQGDPADGIGGKRRAYGNSKPKKKSGVAIVGDMLRAAVQKNESRARARLAAESDPGAKKQKKRQPTPAVIYTRPQAFNRDRLVVQLLTVTAVVVAVVMGLSVFFKVEVITVSGTEAYTPWAVREASGISEGDNLLTFSRTRAGAQIKANLPYVKDVSFGIKLPNTVNIIVEEEDVVYSIKDENGQWWLMNSEGRILEQTTGGKASNYTQVLGVTLTDPLPQQTAQATEKASTATDESGEVIPVTVTGAQRLDAALEILQALEANDIVGSAASVDVSLMEEITLWYGTRYQVNLGDTANLEYKVSCMNNVILQLSDYQSGYLDISFTIWPDRVIYTPFE